MFAARAIGALISSSHRVGRIGRRVDCCIDGGVDRWKCVDPAGIAFGLTDRRIAPLVAGQPVGAIGSDLATIALALLATTGERRHEEYQHGNCEKLVHWVTFSSWFGGT